MIQLTPQQYAITWLHSILASIHGGEYRLTTIHISPLPFDAFSRVRDSSLLPNAVSELPFCHICSCSAGYSAIQQWRVAGCWLSEEADGVGEWDVNSCNVNKAVPQTRYLTVKRWNGCRPHLKQLKLPCALLIISFSAHTHIAHNASTLRMPCVLRLEYMEVGGQFYTLLGFRQVPHNDNCHQKVMVVRLRFCPSEMTKSFIEETKASTLGGFTRWHSFEIALPPKWCQLPTIGYNISWHTEASPRDNATNKEMPQNWGLNFLKCCDSNLARIAW